MTASRQQSMQDGRPINRNGRGRCRNSVELETLALQSAYYHSEQMAEVLIVAPYPSER